MSFISTIFSIVKDAVALKDKHTAENGVPVNYACIFAQSEVEYQEMDKVAAGMGRVVKGTKMGHVYLLEQAIETVAGPLRIVKVRKPDPARKERGDADFTIRDYPAFKEKYLGQSGFKLIEKSDMEMIELADPEFKVLAYFSYPILSKVLGL
ncbi:MAG: hypothetical protein HZC01_00635 [Candidatus Kerfeldbacteria bacterium]|nr:hypothetical protein [Candidatus Kerfeldbacteria bacterium]